MTDASAWIGEREQNAPLDSLDLKTITANLEPGAEILHGILRSTNVKVLFEIRGGASTAAANAQKWFKRLTRVAVIGGAVAALASGLLLYGAGSDAATPAPASAQAAAPAAAPQPPGTAPAAATAPTPIAQELVARVTEYRIVIIVFQILGLAFSTGAGVILSQLKYADVWAENRIKSERLRRDIFNEVLNQAQKMVPTLLPAPDHRNPISQAMELFRRYQHELQIAYYDKGSSKHTDANVILAWGTAVLSAIAAVSGITGSLGGSALILGAFLGIAVPILLGALQSWRAASGDSDKAAAYTKARDALLTLKGGLDPIRDHAAVGDVAAVRAYFDEVHLIMTRENDAWAPAKKP
jgi:hypothetical protein